VFFFSSSVFVGLDARSSLPLPRGSTSGRVEVGSDELFMEEDGDEDDGR
jgi:hypothetical protein